MNGILRLCGAPFLALALACAGCGGDDHTGAKHDEKVDEHGSGGGDASITAAFKELSVADQALAKAQEICPVSEEPLGSMGAPIKMTHGDKTVFLCCGGCRKKFEKDPETYIAKLEKRTR